MPSGMGGSERAPEPLHVGSRSYWVYATRHSCKQIVQTRARYGKREGLLGGPKRECVLGVFSIK